MLLILFFHRRSIRIEKLSFSRFFFKSYLKQAHCVLLIVIFQLPLYFFSYSLRKITLEQHKHELKCLFSQLYARKKAFHNFNIGYIPVFTVTSKTDNRKKKKKKYRKPKKTITDAPNSKVQFSQTWVVEAK